MYVCIYIVHACMCVCMCVCVCVCVCVFACVKCDSLFLGTWLICISYLKGNHDQLTINYVVGKLLLTCLNVYTVDREIFVDDLFRQKLNTRNILHNVH